MVNTKMLVVNSDILPKTYEKVIAAKLLLRTGDAATIQEACLNVGISRSAFYKYKDNVFDYTAQEQGRVVTLFMVLRHTPGVLSDIINKIASVKGNIITINQNIPVMDSASLTASIDTKTMEINPEELLKLLLSCKGCKRVEIIGME
ncbi:MAG TPA: ACT domain-containing protein [Bacillota bacterium]|nr:ACT domain-containing protein [Bacillota bacterium]HPL54720.1 ACT domain-containing protein [Bacillota bacterium]